MRLGHPEAPQTTNVAAQTSWICLVQFSKCSTEPSPCAHVHLHLWGHRDPVLETLPASRSGLTSGKPVRSCRLNGVRTAPFPTAGFAPASPSRAPVQVCSSLSCLGAHGLSLAGSGGSQSPVVCVCVCLTEVECRMPEMGYAQKPQPSRGAGGQQPHQREAGLLGEGVCDTVHPIWFWGEDSRWQTSSAPVHLPLQARTIWLPVSLGEWGWSSETQGLWGPPGTDAGKGPKDPEDSIPSHVHALSYWYPGYRVFF